MDKISEEKSKIVVDKIINLLYLKNDGILETLKLQVSYEIAHIEEEEKIENIKTWFDSEINNLLKDITNFQPQSKNDYDSINVLYKKIFSFLLIKTKQNSFDSINEFQKNSNLGNSIEKEIIAALENVLPKSGLRPFASLSNQEKIAQLSELSDIVMGIYFVNKRN